ncbi:MAG: hypothetical protein Ta2F_05310 [Termitinemataceae bacterium]|nr:MAG: hypothetical protein Ta2F_05310 [Termitinemataceae bacterium]
MIKTSAENFKPAALEKNIQLVCDFQADGTLQITADYSRIKQVIFNILSNAVKYTEHGSVKISVDNKDCVEVSITDTGIGISKTDLPHVFERFYRCDKSRKRGGSGVGLTIAAAIIAAHNGTITVESSEFSGSTFRIRL